MRARITTFLVALLAVLPLVIVGFAYVTSGATLAEVQTEYAKDIFRATSPDLADLTAHHIAPVATATERGARQLAAGIVDIDEPAAVDAYMRTTIESEPLITAVTWQRTDGLIHEFRRDGSRYTSVRFDPNAEEPRVTTTLRTTSGTVISVFAAEGTLTSPDPVLGARAQAALGPVSDAGLSGDEHTLMYAAAADGDPGGTIFVEADLSGLGTFLSDHAPRTTASIRVFVVADGALVAHSRPELIDRAPAGTLVTELSDSPTALAGNLAFGGDGWQLIKVEGENHHAVSHRVDDVPGLEWSIVMIGPEDDFTDQFKDLRRDDTAKLGAIAIIAIVLAIPLARSAVRDVGSLHTAAHRDSLTGLLNRRTFEKHGATMIAAARRRRRSVGALMVDIDHFKQLNDTYGHHAGDEILEAVAGRISHSVAKTDLVARLGGDELALLLDGADLVASRSVANRLKNAVTATPISTNRGPVYVTVSIGASATDAMDRARLEDVLKAADRALYASKRGGRDRITAVEVARTH